MKKKLLIGAALILSVDGGKQWAKVSGERGETGEQGPTGSQGPAGSGGDGGSSFFSDVKVYDDYVEFILTDGTRFSMPVTVENYIDINDIDWDKSNVWKAQEDLLCRLLLVKDFQTIQR